MNKLKEIFEPPLQNRLEALNLALDVLKSQKGKCGSCKYYRPTTMPGFVTDYGECLLKHPDFPTVVLSSEPVCNSYWEDTQKIEMLLSVKAKLNKINEEE